MARFCSEPGCKGVAKRGSFCPLHAQDNYRTRRERNRENPATRRWYGWTAWKRLRIWKLNRNPLCEEPGCTKPATDIHHVDGTWRENGPGAWSLFMTRENLEALCHEHHSARTIKEH
jgi:hypothetical protein